MKSRLHSSTLMVIVLLGLFANQTVASEKSFKLTVKAGEHDRVNAPVSVPVDVPDDVKTIVLTSPDGVKIPAQLTVTGVLGDQSKDNRRLRFILPSLKKGNTLVLSATVSTDKPADGGFAWKNSPGEFAELSHCDRSVLRYVCKPFDDSTPEKRHDTYKAFHHMYSPSGDRIVTKGPGGLYTHHRGLFFGFNRIDYGEGRVDTWGCSGDSHQTHEGFLTQEAGPVLGSHTVAVDWHGTGKKVFAKEKRHMIVYNVPGGLLVEFATRLCSTVGKVKLDGDPQHAGFQFRASQKVAAGDQKLTYYLRPDGKGTPGETRNWPDDKRMVNLPWNALSFVIDGTRYTAVYLDHPLNPKESRYSERTYGRFGAYFVYELDEGKCLELNYRIWLQPGEMTAEEVSALSADFADPVEVVVGD